MVPRLSVVASGADLLADADPTGLAKAIVIIVRHARQCMREGSGLLIETAAAGLEELGRRVRIRIAYGRADEDAESLKRALEPVWTGPDADLPDAYWLVRDMGGFVTSGIERDTVTFDLFLSAGTAAVTDREDAERPAVLLIEPNAALARLVRDYFESNGFRVLESTTCEEAVLIAGLQEGNIRLAIANPGAEDPGRAELAAALGACHSGMVVRRSMATTRKRTEPGAIIWHCPICWNSPARPLTRREISQLWRRKVRQTRKTGQRAVLVRRPKAYGQYHAVADFGRPLRRCRADRE